MDRYEDRAALLADGGHDLDDARSMLRTDARIAAVSQVEGLGIERVDLDQRLRTVTGEAGAKPGASHAVPLIAQAAGVEQKRELSAGSLPQGRRLRRDEARLAFRGAEAARGKQSRDRLAPGSRGPEGRLKGVVF